ncbi:MAG TPA: hypothetical protein VNI77_09820 [Nitrososphaera sp.]|nr:hypothetical protein [Nitrososphaera sp.]
MNWLRNKRKTFSRDLLEMIKRIERGYHLVEMNEREPVILGTDQEERMFKVRSSKDSGKFYSTDAGIKTHAWPDFNSRFLKYKHIILQPGLHLVLKGRIGW